MHRDFHKDDDFKDRNVESEDEDEMMIMSRPRGGEGKQTLTTRQAVLASAIRSLNVSQGASQF